MSTTSVWECVVCYENGATTGQLTLPCRHTVCLGCYTSMGSYSKSLTCPCCRSTINTGEKPSMRSQTNEHNELVRLLAVLDVDMDLDEFLAGPIVPVAGVAPTQARQQVSCVGCRNYFAPEQMARRRVRNADGTLRSNRVMRCPGCGED